MVYFSKKFILADTAVYLSQVFAHPGHDITEEIEERNAFYQNSKRDLSHCNAALRTRGIENRQQKRRQAAVEQARVARGLPPGQYP